MKKNKNSKLIIGIIISLFLIGVILTIFIAGKLSNAQHRPSNGIIINENIQNTALDTISHQKINFNNISIIDSVNQIYLLPVTHTNLSRSEYTSETDVYLGKGSWSRSKRHHKNLYNNLVIHYAPKETSTIVFDERVSINHFKVHVDEEQLYVFMPGCSHDSNEDQVLNADDLQSLFVYDVRNKKLHKIKSPKNHSVLSIHQPDKSHDFVVHFGIDRNKNGEYDNYIESKIYYKLDLEKMEIKEFITSEQKEKLQNLLDGKIS